VQQIGILDNWRDPQNLKPMPDVAASGPGADWEINQNRMNKRSNELKQKAHADAPFVFFIGVYIFCTNGSRRVDEERRVEKISHDRTSHRNRKPLQRVPARVSPFAKKSLVERLDDCRWRTARYSDF